MKLLLGVLMTTLALSGVFSLPARNDPQDDAEVIKVPSRPQPEESDFHNFRGVIDTGSGYPFLQPNPSSFNLGFFGSFDDLFHRLRTRLWPAIGSDSGEDGASPNGDSDESGSGNPFSFAVRPLIPLDSKNANTTSTVKVVDGHKVEINETVYGGNNSVFKVRLVNVRPLESGEEVAQGVHTSGGDFQPAAAPSTSAPPKSTKFVEADEEDEDDRREPLEKQPQDNEVRDIDEPETTTTKSYTTQPDTSSPADSAFEASDISEEIVETLSEEQKKTMDQLKEMMASVQGEIQHQEDLEKDHQEDKEYLENKEKKEREEFDSSDDEDAEATTPVIMSETFNDEWAEFDQDQGQDHDQELDFGNDLNNEIDIEENFVPVDLSNDIAVNDMAAADPDFPHNPDAEFIVHPSVVRTMPMFEKLSLAEPSK